MTANKLTATWPWCGRSRRRAPRLHGRLGITSTFTICMANKVENVPAMMTRDCGSGLAKQWRDAEAVTGIMVAPPLQHRDRRYVLLISCCRTLSFLHTPQSCWERDNAYAGEESLLQSTVTAVEVRLFGCTIAHVWNSFIIHTIEALSLSPNKLVFITPFAPSESSSPDPDSTS